MNKYTKTLHDLILLRVRQGYTGNILLPKNKSSIDYTQFVNIHEAHYFDCIPYTRIEDFYRDQLYATHQDLEQLTFDPIFIPWLHDWFSKSSNKLKYLDYNFLFKIQEHFNQWIKIFEDLPENFILDYDIFFNVEFVFEILEEMEDEEEGDEDEGIDHEFA